MKNRAACPAWSSSRTQTERMVDFCVIYAGLPRYESQVAVKLWRHVLMHLARPHVITLTRDAWWPTRR